MKKALTMNQVDSLYWLGRYTERALSTLRYFTRMYDSMIDGEFDYPLYCRKLDIYNPFSSPEEFCERYAFDTGYQSSIASSLKMANGNAMMVRDIVGSEACSYTEMALRRILDAQTSRSPMLFFQKVADCLMAFRGAVEDTVQDRNAKNVIRTGWGVERLDIYLRLGIHEERVLYECSRLARAVSYTDVPCDSLQLKMITGELCENDEFLDRADKMVLVQLIDALFTGY